MIRAIGFLIVLAGLSALSVWFADNPGQVSLVWQGYVIETSAAVLVMGIVMIAIAAAVLYRLWVALKQAPGKIARNRRDAKTRRGYQALTRGIVAVAAGDAVEAKAQAGRADGLLREPPLTMLLSAQAAQLDGDEAAAETLGLALERREDGSLVPAAASVLLDQHYVLAAAGLLATCDAAAAYALLVTELGLGA